jgi:transcriptional repressor NrdR
VKCHMCGHLESKVVDSRPSHNNDRIRRRRECLACQTRFTTYEAVEVQPLSVIKRDGQREEFSREKLLGGLRRACQKRPVPLPVLEQLVDSIANELANNLVREVPVQVIGDMALERLLEIDKIAYVRFASVYKDFKDPRDFLYELEKLFNLENGRPAEAGLQPATDPSMTDLPAAEDDA